MIDTSDVRETESGDTSVSSSPRVKGVQQCRLGGLSYDGRPVRQTISQDSSSAIVRQSRFAKKMIEDGMAIYR